MLSLLLHSPRPIKKIILVIHDTMLITCVFWIAIGVRLPIQQQSQNLDNWKLLACTWFISVIVFIKLGLYRAILRYMGENMLTPLFVASIASVCVLLTSVFFFDAHLPRSVPITYFLLLLVSLTGSRFTLKGLLYWGAKGTNKPVIIYGAGSSGRQLLESIKYLKNYTPVAFVDDSTLLKRTAIDGINIYHSSKLSKLVERYDVQSILLAIPSATTKQRQKIVNELQPLPCEVMTIPALEDIVDGKVSVNALKKVSIIDLLGRDTVEPVAELISKDIYQKVVMVTGAGGSIGSELCRQIINQQPKKLILFDVSEFALYSIDKELSEYIEHNQLSVELFATLGSVQNQERLTALMKRFNVQTIYHAAAYKHVPLVEYNTMEGVQNNVFGTLRCATASINSNVETFVLISTDKAVRPTNTMGASKRMAELVLQALAKKNDHQTRFCMVRFGNVLGSSGSVIPLFERQIEQGGPITLTHKDITRYFMTIPEAAQLVIQAGAMGQGGDVFVLDMGDPVKIIDLAKKMIALSGLTEYNSTSHTGDIAIEITGLRPGEKLYEELLIGEQVTGSEHPKIMTTHEKMLAWDELQTILASLEHATDSFEPHKVRELLLTAPTDFHPADAICDVLIT